jgi:hypothetical protein
MTRVVIRRRTLLLAALSITAGVIGADRPATPRPGRKVRRTAIKQAEPTRETTEWWGHLAGQ